MRDEYQQQAEAQERRDRLYRAKHGPEPLAERLERFIHETALDSGLTESGAWAVSKNLTGRLIEIFESERSRRNAIRRAS